MPATSDPLCRVVITYARVEQHHRKTFRGHAADLERSGVEFFDDQDIPPGAAWEATLFDKLDRADIIVLLLSSHYVSSDYCMDVELPRAMRRWQAGECRLFPVNVAPFDLTLRSPLRQLQWIPSGKSVTEYGTAAAREWRKVTQELRKMTESMGGAPGAGTPAAPYGAGGGARTPGGRPAAPGNSITGSVVHGPAVQIGEFTGNLTLDAVQHPPADGPGS
ncbi:toll/interleukin-1 receptor domain-containing protein [Streptomyces sp. NPDC057438]|uniref:toll/interleukin-1 receptor domain-containing protein n=1 Tax=Streptomyces sp. NPDC057438 TaxID=3346133 RepID=UPI0036846FD8